MTPQGDEPQVRSADTDALIEEDRQQTVALAQAIIDNGIGEEGSLQRAAFVLAQKTVGLADALARERKALRNEKHLSAVGADALDELREVGQRAERAESLLKAENSRAELLEAQVEALREAARPLAENWDFRAMDYLAELVDGEEQRIMPAGYVEEIIQQQRTLREALDSLPPPQEYDGA